MEKDISKKKKEEIQVKDKKTKTEVKKNKKRSRGKRNSRNNKKDIKKSKLLGFFVILFSILGFILLLLILNVLINFNVVNKKIDKVTKLKEDVAFIEKTYDNILKLNEEKKKLDLSNNDYNGKIVNIKKDIENINININKLKASK